jgi:hypothetical protein
MSEAKLTLGQLANLFVERRAKAMKQRLHKKAKTIVNLDTCEVFLDDEKAITVDPEHMEEFLMIYISMMDLLIKSVKTKRFDVNEYHQLNREINLYVLHEEGGVIVPESEEDSEENSGDLSDGTDDEYWTLEELESYFESTDDRRGAAKALREAGADEDLIQEALKNTR